MWRCIHRLEVFPLLKSRSQPKCFSLQVEVLSPKNHTGMTKCPFLLKGNALHYLCQLKNGGSQTGNIWWLWPEVILPVKYSIWCLWLPFAQEAVPPGDTIGDPTVTFMEMSPEEPALCQHKPICYGSRAPSSHLACLTPTMMPSSTERTRGLIKNKGDLSFWHVKIFHSFFSPTLFLSHTSMKNSLNGLIFFFPTSFFSIFTFSCGI